MSYTGKGAFFNRCCEKCGLIENWPAEADAKLIMDGRSVEPGPDFRQGIEKNADEVASLVVWVRKESTSPLDFVIKP